ncbi:DUF4123 domain-containing protein [Erwinia aphidicola]|nr:DUF4123 domain-containing protein [Erwinia aphidicola]
MDASMLLMSVAAMDEYRLSLLLEGGAQTPQAFAAFHAQHAPEMSSLYLHPQLAKARDVGPWLLEVPQPDRLGEYLVKTPGVAAAILSTHQSGTLAAQLATACTVINPSGKTVVMRFYARHAIGVLAQQNQQPWHALLFNGIMQWWAPAEAAWQQIAIPPSTANNARDHAVRLDKEAWQQLADNPEISTLLAQWRTLSSSRHFSPCTQRNMAIKALAKAQAAGITLPLDQKLYALCYLDGGKAMLESEAMRASLHQVIQGTVPLAQLLKTISG